MPDYVCNTSPIQYLHQLGILDVIKALYGRVLVPRAVEIELSNGLAAGVDLPQVSGLAWIEIRVIGKSPWPIPRDIHAGEAEVIALAGSLTDPVVILDDLAARRHAKLLGIPCTGTLGILLRAKTSGLIGELSPFADRLNSLGFRIARETRNELLKLAGEE